MTSRRSFSPMRREAIFLANGGRCHLCERKIRVGEPWDVSHDRPLALLGEDDGDNLKVAHRDCHAIQTRQVDAPAIVKAKRCAAKHIGAIRPTGKWPAGRDSKWKIKIGGRAVPR